MLRYRTRDLSRIYTEKCPCGRTIRTFERISARSDDMLIIRGVNVFPSQIEEVILKVEDIEPHYRIIVDIVDKEILICVIRIGDRKDVYR